jgi:hypothetical protein
MMTSACAANAVGVLELVDRFLGLVVEDGAIGDDDDGVKLLCALRGVERGELVGDPGDGVRFAGAWLCWMRYFWPGPSARAVSTSWRTTSHW